MFEINITNDRNSEFSQQAEKWHGFDENIHSAFLFNSDNIIIQGLRYKNEKNDVFINSEHLIILCGKVFYSLNYSENLMPLTAEMVYSLYLENSNNFLHKIKGNFLIFIYNIQSGKFLLAKDKLGLKYVYFRQIENDFYISTNLNDFKRIDYKFDYNVSLEHLLFTYPISENSFIDQVKMLGLGSLIRFESGKIKTEKYFLVDDLFPERKPVKKFCKKTFVELFEKSVLQRANCDILPNVSLTGGFDGRSNVAVLLNNKRNFHAYSFGKKGGENTKIPLMVANKLQLNYTPVYLDDEYERDYLECALDALYFSDGISRFERANYIFALRQIAKISNINITGLLGGEALAPVHLKSDYINPFYYNLFYGDNTYSIDNIIYKINRNNFINKSFIELIDWHKFTLNVESHKNKIETWKSKNYPWTYYLKDLISTGFQRFYGNQMHLERYYCENLSPFYDFDLLYYLYSTNYINVFKKAFKNTSPFRRINNRILQTYIITNFSRTLSKLPVDRGYPPSFNINLGKLIIPYFYFIRIKKLKNLNQPDFTSPIWNKIMYNHLINNLNLLSKFYILEETSLVSFMKSYEKNNYSAELTLLTSIELFLNI